MSIEIVVDGVTDLNKSNFHPGETVRGRVKYKVSKQRTIQTAAITLNGSLKAEYIPVQQNNSALVLVQGPRRPNKLKVSLFEHTTKLFDGPYSVPPQEFDWPFEFIIPNETETELTRQRSGTQSLDFVFDLPPSYTWSHQPIAHNVYAEIAYKLAVKVECSGLLKNDSLDQVLILRQRRNTSGLESEVKPRRNALPLVSWTSHELRPAERRLSLSQKMKSKVSKDPALKAPTLTFESAVYLPHAVDLQIPFSISFSLTHRTENENDPSDPSFVLEKLRLTWSERTSITLPKTGIFTNESLSKGEIILARRDIELIQKIEIPAEGQVVEIARDICISDWLEKDKANIPGDFDTFVIQLGYRLAVELEIRHVESEKTFRLSTSCPIRLLDAAPDQLPEYAAGSSALQHDEQLPAYARAHHDAGAAKTTYQ